LLASRAHGRQCIVRLVRDMQKRLNPSQFPGLQTHSLVLAFEQLLSLDIFFDMIASMKFLDALHFMSSLGLIPFLPEQIQPCTATFHRLHETIKRLFPEILSTIMQLLTHQHSLLTQTPFDNSRAERDQNIRVAAKAIVTFSGTIQYQIPKDLTAQLLSSELIIRS
jgi:Nup93/Nic96